MTAPERVAGPDLRTKVLTVLKRPLLNPLFFKLWDRYEKRLPDIEVRQLTALRAAYAGPDGPEVLLFGDSAMFWTRAGEPDPRSLGDLLAAELGRSVRLHTIVGPGYNPAMVSAFLTALSDCASRPRVVVIPTSLMMAGRGYLRHPVLGHERESAALREIIAAGPPYPTRLPRASEHDWDEYDRQPAASFTAAKRTNGEVRIVINAIPPTQAGLPTTKWQHLVRVRMLLEFANAERLEPDSPGVQVAAEAAADVAALGPASIAYLPPVNVEVMQRMWGAKVSAHITRNAAVLETAYRSAGGSRACVVNAVQGTPASEFSDPAHLNAAGRQRFAARLAAEIRRSLAP